MTNDTITIEDLKRIQDEIRDTFRVPMDPVYPSYGPQQFVGLPVMEVPINIVQKIKIRDDFKWCTDEGRNKINDWLFEMFGCYDQTPIPPGQVFMFNHSMLAIRKDEMSAITHLTGA